MSVQPTRPDETAPPPSAGPAPGSGSSPWWQVATRLATAADVSTTLRRVVEAAQAVFASDAAAILLYDPEQDLFLPAVPSVAVGLDERWLQRQGLEGAQVLARQAARAQDVLVAPDQVPLPDLDVPLLAGPRPVVALCAAPLMSEGGVVGVVELYDAGPHPASYAVEDLRAFAALAGLMIARARARERDHALVGRLQALDEASKAMAAELSLERVLQRIVEAAARIVGARYGALGVVGPDGYLVDFITTGLAPEERAQLGPLPRGHGLLGVLIRAGQAVRVPNIQRDPRRVGFPPHHPPMTSLLGVPVRVRGAVVCDLYLTDKIGAPEFSAEDQGVIEMLAAHAGIAVENARLYAQLSELTLLRERERIARDLHDSIIQDLYAGTLQLEDLEEELPDAAAQQRVQRLGAHFSDVIRDVRRYVEGLRARELEERPLHEALHTVVQEVQGRGGVLASYAVEGEPYAVPDVLATAMVQIAREALSNVIKHAGATQVHVGVTYEGARVVLMVRDDGRGFDPAAPRSATHQGLRNLRARAEEVGGTFRIDSAAGAGATVWVALPGQRPDLG